MLKILCKKKRKKKNTNEKEKLFQNYSNLQVKIFSFEKKSIHGTKNFCRSVFNYS